MKILVVDDDAVSRRMLAAILQRWGHEVMEAADGEEVMRLFEGDAGPKVMVLDWMMPGLDGVEVCRRLRSGSRHAGVYIILLTAKGGKADIAKGLDAGANDYIVKPFDLVELHARLNVGIRVIELQERLKDEVARLQDALSHVKTLQGILPICANCHRIRNDEESWQKIESYLEDHSDIAFSHGLCPECATKLYPDLVLEDDEELDMRR